MKFVEIDTIVHTPAQGNKDEKTERFKMFVRAQAVFGLNPVTEGPTPDVKSIIYFDSATGMRPVLSAEEVGALRVKIERAAE